MASLACSVGPRLQRSGIAARSSSGVRQAQRQRLVPRAQQGGSGGGAAGPAEAHAAEQQAAATVVADTAEQQQQEEPYEEEVLEVVDVVTSTPAAAGGAGQEQAVAVGVPPPPPPAGRPGLPLSSDLLAHPAVRMAGYAAAGFLAVTFVISRWRAGRDPEKRRSKTINKNKAVIDTIAKYLPGNRAGLTSGAFTVLKLQTGFSPAEIFRKYLWFLLRERPFDEEALADLVALKEALGLDDAQVAEAIKERAQRVYEKYGTIMVNLEGFSKSGIERQAAARNLFNKLLSLLDSRALLGGEAAATVDLGKIFGVTPRDILTLRSGYSAEAEGSALQDEESGEEGEAA